MGLPQQAFFSRAFRLRIPPRGILTSNIIYPHGVSVKGIIPLSVAGCKKKQKLPHLPVQQPLSLSADYLICLFLQFSLLPASGQRCEDCSGCAHQTQIQVCVAVISGERPDIVVICLSAVLSARIRCDCFLLIPVIEVDFLLGSGGPFHGKSSVQVIRNRRRYIICICIIGYCPLLP